MDQIIEWKNRMMKCLNQFVTSKGIRSFADNDPTPEEPEDNLLKRCFFLDSLVMLIIPHSKFFKNYIVFDINYT